MSTVEPRPGNGWRHERSAAGINAAATVVLAAVGAAFTAGILTSAESSAPIVMIGAVAALQALAFAYATELSLRYRILSALGLLVLFASAFVPGVIHEAPLTVVAALALSALGSMPIWAIAVWRVTLTRRALG